MQAMTKVTTLLIAASTALVVLNDNEVSLAKPCAGKHMKELTPLMATATRRPTTTTTTTATTTTRTIILVFEGRPEYEPATSTHQALDLSPNPWEEFNLANVLDVSQTQLSRPGT